MAPYGEVQPDGSVAIFTDDGVYIGTESQAQNQGLEGGGLASRNPEYAKMIGYTPPPPKKQPSTSGSVMNVLPIEQMQLELQAMQQRYLQERLRLVEIPEMQLRDERERISLALQMASYYAEQAGYVVPPTTFMQYLQKEGNLTTTGAVQEVRRRLQETGSPDFMALLDKSDAELTKHILGDPSLFVGDPIRDQLSGKDVASGQFTFGMPEGFDITKFPKSLAREQFESESEMARAQFLASLAKSPGDYRIYQMLRSGQIPGVAGPEVAPGIRRNIPLAAGLVPESWQNVPAFARFQYPNQEGVIDSTARVVGEPVLGLAQEQQQRTLSGLLGPPAVTSEPSLGGVRPRSLSQMLTASPTDVGLYFGDVALTGEPTTDRAAYEETLLKRLGAGAGAGGFLGIGVAS